MPIPDEDQLGFAQPDPIRVTLAPAYNSLNDLMLISRSQEQSGYSEWIYQASRSLNGDQIHDLQVIAEGLHYAIFPDHEDRTFPQYIQDMSNKGPGEIRQRLFQSYFKCHCKTPEDDITRQPDFDPKKEIKRLSSDFDAFLEFLGMRFPKSRINIDVERNVHELLNKPARLQDFIVNILKTHWDNLLKEEWHRVQPLLNEALQAFKQVDFSKMDKLDALMLVVEQKFQDEEKVREILRDKRLILVPSAHMGPYHYKYKSPGKIVFTFGARPPMGLPAQTPLLSRSELLVRFNALADETRMEILQHINNHGECSSQDIMHAFNLSQSSVSRHLTQLSATGFLNERRVQGSKKYSLNSKRFNDTFQAMDLFLSS